MWWTLAALAQTPFDPPERAPLQQFVGRANVDVFSLPITPDCFRHPLGDGTHPPEAFDTSQAWRGKRKHLGEDWRHVSGDSVGQTIHAMADGTVHTAEDFGQNGWGLVVRIAHRVEQQVPEGGKTSRLEGYTFYETLYAHLDRLDVSPGQRVKAGDVIGTIGESGGVNHAHLHLEVRDVMNLDLGQGYGLNTRGYLEPSAFMTAHRCE